MRRDAHWQFLPNAGADDADVVFLPLAYEGTVSGARGTAKAPAAILKASELLEYYEEDMGWSPFLHLRCRVLPEIKKTGKETEAEFHRRLGRLASEIALREAPPFLVALGGEHSITPSLVAGALARPATIVVLDAHADLRETYRGNPFNHACTCHRLLELGHRVIIAGMRSLAESEAERIRKDDKLTVYPMTRLGTREGRAQLLAEVRQVTGQAWLSIDMDAFDPALVPSVGTPQPGGMDWALGVDILSALLLQSTALVHGIDIVEVIPEATLVSQLTAAKIAQKAISFWGKKMQRDAASQTGSQAGTMYE